MNCSKFKKMGKPNRELLIFAIFIFSSQIYAETSGYDDFKETFGDVDFITLATGRAQKIAKAPAVASVFTADDIKEMGALSLQEVLETLPGIHVSVAPGNYLPVYLIRGITSTFNPHVLILINGNPMTNVFLGNRGQAWGGMPVENIERIEVIRGPGSAVHGADAFAGMINIITKGANELNVTNYGLRTGSYGTKDGWVQQTGNLGTVNMSASLEFRKTDGQDGIITQDRQTQLDNIFSTNASLAPGSVNTQSEWLDVRVEFSYENWLVRTGYQARRNMGTGAGVAQALDSIGKVQADRINFDLTYDQLNAVENWDATFKLSYLDVSNRSELVLFPAGAFGGAFPNGFIGNPEVNERHIRIQGDAFYTRYRDHTLRIGTGAHFTDMYKIKESKNFNVDNSPKVTLTDVSDTSEVFIPEKDREVYYAYLQDEWAIDTDFILTAGLRYDYYSDFGSTTNPRLALVWNFSYNITTKLLYGRAFRPPSFAELFNQNNPVALGNTNLSPETIDTYEWAIDYQVTSDFSTRLNSYYYKMKDIIQFVPDAAPATSKTAQNNSDQTGHGLEWEGEWRISDTLKLSGNYAFQRTRDKSAGQSAGQAPKQQVYARVTWQAMPGLSSTVQLNWVADRKRAAGDNRPAVDNYATFDFTLRYLLMNNLEFSLIGKNVFDEDVREPSPAPGFIPNDLPQAGRQVFFEARYSY